MLAAEPSAMAGVHLRWLKNVYFPLACPMRATPAAEPMDKRLPPTPAVRMTKSHCPSDISGFMVNTANMIGILSTIADKVPTIARYPIFIDSNMRKGKIEIALLAIDIRCVVMSCLEFRDSKIEHSSQAGKIEQVVPAFIEVVDERASQLITAKPGTGHCIIWFKA